MVRVNRREFLKAGLAASAVSIADWRLFAAEEGLPAYYGEHLAKVAARVGKLADFCVDGFWFITDLHTPRNMLKSGPLLTRLVRTTPIRKVLSGGGNRTLHCRPSGVSVRGTRKFETSLPGKVSWGCYDADRVDNKPDPTNKWMKLAVYHNNVSTISPDGVLTALKSGEAVVVALAENGDKEMFPVVVGDE